MSEMCVLRSFKALRLDKMQASVPVVSVAKESVLSGHCARVFLALLAAHVQVHPLAHDCKVPSWL